jgi:hypothetical protein
MFPTWVKLKVGSVILVIVELLKIVVVNVELRGVPGFQFVDLFQFPSTGFANQVLVELPTDATA